MSTCVAHPVHQSVVVLKLQQKTFIAVYLKFEYLVLRYLTTEHFFCNFSKYFILRYLMKAFIVISGNILYLDIL